ncbi:MAG: BREX-1 system phosphatase PglZ type B [Thermomicrobiales bacterium]
MIAPATTPAESPSTVLDALVAALRRAGEHNDAAEVAPAAILWPDGESQWRGVVPALRPHLPILTLGDYQPERDTGPASWIRAELATREPADTPPVIYLPGLSKDDLRRVEEAPSPASQLVYLQYRGTLFLQPNGKDWTVAAFLQNAQYGLGLALDKSEATRTSLLSTAPRLLHRPVAELRAHPGGIDAGFLQELLIPDLPGLILDWINNPSATRDRLDDASWGAFCAQLNSSHGLDPERDGPSEAARKLGEAKVGSRWVAVWSRFVASPAIYPRIPKMLRGAKPAETGQRTLFAAENDHWPQDNERQEGELRQALTNLAGSNGGDARAVVISLDVAHEPRRQSVWAKLGEAPLADAMQHLTTVATGTQTPFPAGSFDAMQRTYTEQGWRIDAAALNAATAVTAKPDRDAFAAALHAIYTPWLWDTAERFQEAIGNWNEPTEVTPLAVPPGSCVLFADGRRYDLAARLADGMKESGLGVAITSEVGPLPGVTPSAKPAQSPVAGLLTGGATINAAVAATGTALSQTSFKKLLADQGWRFLDPGATGAPDGEIRAWTELGAIDSYGHNHPDDLPRQAQGELLRLQQRIGELLDAGWERVIAVTDHGWLLTPRPMEKTDLPAHLAVQRKGRCARLNPAASTPLQTVAWRWEPEVRIAMAPGISCFEEGKRYEHGGLSLQECVVPTITVTAGTASRSRASVSIAGMTWRGLRCVVMVAGEGEGLSIDVRQQAGDATSSLAASPQPVGEDGTARILVTGSDTEGDAAALVVLDDNGHVIASQTTKVGGE